ncbi:MAG: amidohydrolase [Oscillospiraceae bacterium]|nr:amidohydrolase [Oscillospiraceae bacterium]
MNILIKDILALLPEGVSTCSVYISGGTIASTGFAPEGFTPDKTINGSGKMLIPGLVNAHTHASMTILRNCADDLLFNDWLFGRILPLEEKFTGEDCHWGIKLAIMEMLRCGTASFIDMYSFMDDLAQAVADTGIRAVLSRGLVGGSDDFAASEQRMKEALDAVEKWKDIPNLSFMLAPHAPYTCDEGFLREIATEAKRQGLPITTHISESLSEIETIKERYGCTPVELCDRAGLLTDTTVAAHCVHLTDNDISILASRGVTVATNPVSNLKLANGIAPVPKMLKAGVKVALGTDGAASNNTLNMFRELTMLTLIHKGVNHDAKAVSAREGINIATKNGAMALGRSDLGEIRPGNIADLAIIDLGQPNMQPLNDPAAALAYSSNGSEVETVIVGGKILMENREFLTIDAERTVYEVSKICERIGTK